MFRCATGLLFLLGLALAPQSQTPPPSKSAAAKAPQKVDSLRNLVPRRWWESASISCGMSIKPRSGRAGAPAEGVPPVSPLKDLTKAGAMLDEMKARGCAVITLGDPAETAGRVYPGLATKDHYRLPADAGTLDQFRRLVRLIHSKGLPVTISYNLGYASLEADHFLKACDDVKAGRDTKEVRWFLWSDRADAPPPIITKDTFFMVRPTHLPGAKPGTFYDSSKAEVWEYSERAGRYFWSKWSGNVDGKIVRLPQYNWMSPEFQVEAEKITRFWMDTGIDGMLHDAVNWYVGYTWEKGRRRITDVIASYGNTWRLAEGSGGFYEDPVAWITEGNWNAMIDYGLGIWWENKNAIVDAINSSDPRLLEKALRGLHDPVVAAGGVLSASGGRMDFSQEPQKQRFAVAILATIGEFFSPSGRGGGPQQKPDDETLWLVKTKTAHPALHNLSTRRLIPTAADDKYYAVLRTARDGSERVLVVMNFQASPQKVEVDLSGVAAAGLVELKGGQVLTRQNPFRVELPAYGYRLYQVKPPIVK